MSVCDEYCRPCVYSSLTPFIGWNCNFYLVYGVGNRRGCPAGDGCERRIIGDEKKASIDFLAFKSPTKRPKKEPSPESIARKKAYQHDWYLRHKEEQNAKRRERYAASKGESCRQMRQKKSWVDRKHFTEQRTRAICQGRQREAINAYLNETGLTCGKLATLVGVNEVTLRNWRNERNMADWVKLAQVGIRRPDGL